MKRSSFAHTGLLAALLFLSSLLGCADTKGPSEEEAANKNLSPVEVINLGSYIFLVRYEGHEYLTSEMRDYFEHTASCPHPSHKKGGPAGQSSQPDSSKSEVFPSSYQSY